MSNSNAVQVHSSEPKVPRATDSTRPASADFMHEQSLSQAVPTKLELPRNDPSRSLPQAMNMDLGSSLERHPRLTFFQRHFTKPDHNNGAAEKSEGPARRRFSFVSRGFILSTIALAAMLLGIIAVTVALTVGRGHTRPVDKESVLPDPPPHTKTKPTRLALGCNFPDPALLYDDGTWYAYATNNAAGVLSMRGANASKNSVAFGQANVQMSTSKDFVHWTMTDLAQEPLPSTGAWASRRKKKPPGEPEPLSSTWAPAVIKRDDGRYVMYYSATWNGAYPYKFHNGHPIHPQPHCVGAAISNGTSPAGPYEPLDKPLACPVAQGGAIDPEALTDVDGSIWVTWKVDGNNIGHGGSCGNTIAPQAPTPIMIQKMQADGITPAGNATQILDRTPADGPLVEAPAIVRTHQGKYFLFFSSGCTRSPDYAVKYAVSDSITGPYVRATETLLSTGMYGLEAPGSVGIAEDGKGGWKMAFHARAAQRKVGRVRKMFTTQLVFEGEVVKLVSPAEGNAAEEDDDDDGEDDDEEDEG